MEPEDTSPVAEFDISRHAGGRIVQKRDSVAREEPLEVKVNGRTQVYLMRLPGDEVPLAAGFLLSEGLIHDPGQIVSVRHSGANLVEIDARVDESEPLSGEARLVRTGSGGAGLGREVDLDRIRVESDMRFSREVITRAPRMLLEHQEVFKATGGTHGAGIFDSAGRVPVVMEDVGRHNAVDKALGFVLLSGEGTRDKGLVLSGRLSYEMVLKAARAGMPLVCSVSAPTSLGVEVAVRTGVTLVGFLRGDDFNVYSHPERVGGG